MHAAFLAAALSLAAVPAAPDEGATAFARDVQPFLKKHCLGCHGARKQNSGVRFDLVERYRSEEGPLWTKVHEAIAQGAMPPEEQAQPDRTERERILSWIEAQQRSAVGGARRLNASMKEETIAYVSRLFADNRPAAELIASDWTMMNDGLAIHYGYQGVEGGQLRKVTLRKDEPRGGGILSHAGIQSMLCWMGGNWVIYRGAWAMRHVLDDPPPPPPLEVPELNPAAHKGKTFKELLKIHQENANCAVCHRKMAPLGFAFQNFDISGRWRDQEYDGYHMADLDGRIEWRGVGKGRPVDAVGQLPRGEKFTTFAQCKALLVKHYQADLVRGLLKNLVVHATGRLPDVHDLAEIRGIMKEHEARGYPLRDVLKALLRSPTFLKR